MSIDYQFLPVVQSGYEQEYTAQGTWQLWEKPRGITFVYMLIIGAGAVGGDGFGDAAGGGGGGGGGSGGQNVWVFPADALPDCLYIYIARTGERTVVATYPDGAAPVNVLASSGSVAATAGGNGTGAAGGAFGGGETAFANALAAFQSVGVKTTTTGQSGSAGGVPNISGSSLNQLTNRVVSGGTGGGGITAAVRTGGSLTTGQDIPVLLGGTTDGQRGASGPIVQRPWQPLSGTGGASSLLTDGGQGGDANFGGGGGGGGATTAGVGGAGGRGGGGYVLMVAW